jgi:hypothetical protein
MSNEGALGKGRTAIFRQPSAQAEVPSADIAVQITESEPRASETELGSSNIDLPTLQKALEEADAKSKITIWQPDVSAVLRYMQLMTVRYSMSKDAARLLAKAVESEYPEAWEAVKRNRKS